MRRVPIIDDPNSGEAPAWRLQSLEKLGAAECIPYDAPVRKTVWDIEYEELIERQRGLKE